MGVIRIGVGLSRETHTRLQGVLDRLKAPQSKLVAAIVSVLSDDEIKTLLQRYDRLREIETEIRQVADEHMLVYIRGKSLSDLEKMLAAARSAGSPS